MRAFIEEEERISMNDSGLNNKHTPETEEKGVEESGEGTAASPPDCGNRTKAFESTTLEGSHPTAASGTGVSTSLYKRCQNLEQRCQDAEDAMLSVKLGQIHEHDQHRRTVDILSADILRLEDLNNKLQSERGRLAASVDSLTRERGELSDDVAYWRAQYEQQMAQIEDLRGRGSECERLARELKQWKHTCEVTAKAQVSLESQNFALRAELEEAQRQNARLQQEMQDKEAASAEVAAGRLAAVTSKSKSEAEEEVHQLQTVVAQLQSALAKRDLQYKTVKDAKDYFEDKCTELNAAAAQLEDLLHEAGERLKESNRQLERAAASEAAVRQQLAALDGANSSRMPDGSRKWGSGGGEPAAEVEEREGAVKALYDRLAKGVRDLLPRTECSTLRTVKEPESAEERLRCVDELMEAVENHIAKLEERCTELQERLQQAQPLPGRKPLSSSVSSLQESSAAVPVVASGENDALGSSVKVDGMLLAAVQSSLSKSRELLATALRQHGKTKGIAAAAAAAAAGPLGADTTKPSLPSTMTNRKGSTSDSRASSITTITSKTNNAATAALDEAEEVRSLILELLPHTRDAKASAQLTVRKTVEKLELTEGELRTVKSECETTRRQLEALRKKTAAESQKQKGREQQLMKQSEEEQEALLKEKAVLESSLEAKSREVQLLAKKAKEYKSNLDELIAFKDEALAQMQADKTTQGELTAALEDMKLRVVELQDHEAVLQQAVQEHACRRDAATRSAERLFTTLEQVTRLVVLLLFAHRDILCHKRILAAATPSEAMTAPLLSATQNDDVRNFMMSLDKLISANSGTHAAVPLSLPSRSHTTGTACVLSRQRHPSVSRPRSLRAVALAVMAVGRLRILSRMRSALHREQERVNVLSADYLQHRKFESRRRRPDGRPRVRRAPFKSPVRKPPVDTSQCHTPKVVFFPEDAKFEEFSPAHRNLFDDAGLRKAEEDVSTHPSHPTIPLYRTFSLETAQFLEGVTTSGVLPDVDLPPLVEVSAFLETVHTESDASTSNTAGGSCFRIVDYLLTNSTIDPDAPVNLFFFSTRRAVTAVRPSAAAATTAARQQPKSLAANLQSADEAAMQQELLNRLERYMSSVKRSASEKDSELQQQLAIVSQLQQRIKSLESTVARDRDEQDAITADLEAVEQLVRTRPSEDDLRSLREQLAHARDEQMKERERRRAAEADLLQRQSSEMVWRAEENRLKNEIRSLTIELGRAYNSGGDSAAPRYALEQVVLSAPPAHNEQQQRPQQAASECRRTQEVDSDVSSNTTTATTGATSTSGPPLSYYSSIPEATSQRSRVPSTTGNSTSLLGGRDYYRALLEKPANHDASTKREVPIYVPKTLPDNKP